MIYPPPCCPTVRFLLRFSPWSHSPCRDPFPPPFTPLHFARPRSRSFPLTCCMQRCALSAVLYLACFVFPPPCYSGCPVCSSNGVFLVLYLGCSARGGIPMHCAVLRVYLTLRRAFPAGMVYAQYVRVPAPCPPCSFRHGRSPPCVCSVYSRCAASTVL